MVHRLIKGNGRTVFIFQLERFKFSVINRFPFSKILAWLCKEQLSS